MDKLHYFVNQVNEIHRKGYSTNRAISTPGGEGINFFAEVKDVEDASLKIKLSKNVENDLANIMSASKPNSPGDNTVAIKISQLQFKKSMDDGKSTMEEYFLQNVGSIESKQEKLRLKESKQTVF